MKDDKVAIAAGLASMLVAAWAIVSGCTTADQKRIQDEIDRIEDNVTPTTTTTTTTTTQPPVVIPPSLQGDNTFLWKPVSENNGRLVVLIPARLLADACTVGTEKGAGVGRHNGNREHFRFSKPGSAYGRNVLVVSYYQGAETGRWTVPDGAGRKSFSGWRRMMFWRKSAGEDV